MQPGEPRVLLLFMADESASGANLTAANHVIFVHPLLAKSQQAYEQCRTQAVGRIRRYGQTRVVHVHDFLAEVRFGVEAFERFDAFDAAR